MKSRVLRALMIVVLTLGPMATLAFKVQASADNGGQKQAVSQHDMQKAGERVFMANCSRCHNPPMSITPRTTGTIIMHMRTRARLSRQDEQLLLKFMAP